MKKKKYSIKIKIWITEETCPFLGRGRVMLLDKIKETGSITNAAKKLNMSYKKAWLLVEDMNKQGKQPVVKKILGGKNGSRSVLTKYGESVIYKFHELENQTKKFLNKKSKEIAF